MKSDIIKAHERIREYIQTTPLIKAHAISSFTGANVLFKLENIQPTGSFKIRGALNKVLLLNSSDRKKGMVTASSGNHGAAVAYAAKLLEIPVKVFVPTSTPENKLENIKLFGCMPELVGNDAGESEMKAKQYAQRNNITYISPYNDYDIICGQGTIAYEIEQQTDAIDEMYIAVGGGGLISGIGGYLKKLTVPPKIIACLPQASPVMYESVKAGKIIECDIQPTLSDGTAGNIDMDSITFGYCQQFVDDYSLVPEIAIRNSMALSIEKEHLLVEGAAGVSIAALLNRGKNIKGKNVIVVICGGNISLETMKSIICR